MHTFTFATYTKILIARFALFARVADWEVDFERSCAVFIYLETITKTAPPGTSVSFTADCHSQPHWPASGFSYHHQPQVTLNTLHNAFQSTNRTSSTPTSVIKTKTRNQQCMNQTTMASVSHYPNQCFTPHTPQFIFIDYIHETESVKHTLNTHQQIHRRGSREARTVIKNQTRKSWIRGAE